MAEPYETPPSMQDIYDKDKERYKESDELIREGDLKGATDVHPDKKLLGTDLLNSIEGGVTGSIQWLQKQAEENPDTYTDDVLRLLGGGIKNTAWALSKIPLLDKLAQGEDWLAGQARGLSEQLTPWLDPRFAGWGTRIGTGILADKGARKVLSGIKGFDKARRYSQIVQGKGRFGQTLKYGPTPSQRGLNPDLAGSIIAQINEPNYRQLDLFPDPLSKITPGKEGWPKLHRNLPFTGENLAEIAAKGLDEATLRSLRDAGVSEQMIFTMKHWDETGKLLSGEKSRAAAAAVQRPFVRQDFFEAARLQLIPIFEEGFLNAGTTLKPRLHHIAGLKASLPLYDGIKVGKIAYKKLNKALQELEVFPGHHLNNFKMLSDESHLAIHRFMDDVIGKSGEVFFTPERMKLIRKSTAGRLQVAREYGKLVRRSREMAVDIHNQYKALYGKGPSDVDRIIRVMEEADRLYKKLGSRYSNESLRNIIEQIEKVSQKELLDEGWNYQMWLANQEEIRKTGKPLPGMVTPKVERVFKKPKNPKKKLR